MSLRDWNEHGAHTDPETALKSGDFRTALSAFATRHLLDFRTPFRIYSDHDLCGFGVVLWLMGDSSGAANLWSRVCEEAVKGRFTHSTMATFQSGLLLWFASVWLKNDDWHNEAEALFEKLLRKKRPVMGAGYPSLLAKLMRRELDLSEVEAGQSDVALLREREQTQALFYAGVRAFEEGQMDETAKIWQRMGIPANSLVELEYYLLLHERERLRR